MFEASLLAEPSTARPTATPAVMYFFTGAMPEARRMFELGQCATPQPARAKRAISASLTWTAWANQTSPATQPRRSIHSTGRTPKRSSV